MSNKIPIDKQGFVQSLLQKKQQQKDNQGPEDTLSFLFGVNDYHSLTMDRFATGQDATFAEIKGFNAWKQAAMQGHEYVFESARETPQANEITVLRQDGARKQMLNFSGYNYLGYSHHPEVIQAAKDAIDQYGIGAGSSPVSTGTTALHEQFAGELVRFFGMPDRGVSLFSSGYSVNVGTLSAILSPGHYALMDQAAHMSIIEGAQSSGANLLFFEHNNMTHLESQLKKISGQNKRVVICAEGVYSADGDFGDIRAIVDLAKKYGAQTLVDEAHSILLIGDNGRGVCDAQDVLNDIDFLVLTFSKGFGGVGGALIAKKEYTDYVNWYARCRMFSCALDPGVTGGMLKALELAQSHDGNQRRNRLHRNAETLKQLLNPLFNIGETGSWVVPVIYGDEKITLPLTNSLQDLGMEGSAMQYPAVPKGEARIRLFVTANHTENDLIKAKQILVDAGKTFGFKVDCNE